MTELAALKKQRATNKGKLTNIIKFAKEAGSHTTMEELNVRLNRVEILMQQFTALEMEIFKLDPAESSDAVYEENYYNAVATLNTLIRGKSVTANNGPDYLDHSNNTTSFGIRSEVKLPKINIPCFSGDYCEWPSFYDLYHSTIHESASLNAVQKFQYLKGLLRGEAAMLLRHINITEANYIGALIKLKDRYDRKKHIIGSFIRTFVEQAPVRTSNVSQLKRLMDTSDEVIRGLKALGEVAESRDHWLIYILLHKLDDDSKVLWAETAADYANPEFSQFLKFLERRIDTLESLATSSKRTNLKSEIKGHIAINEPSSSESIISTSEIATSEPHDLLANPLFKCVVCQDQGHSLFQCKDFQELDVNGRRDFVKRSNRCFNCISSKHLISRCPSRRRCQKCNRKHHTLLHLNEPSDVEPQNMSATTSVHASIQSRPNPVFHSLLPTAIVKVVDSSGKLLPCRALLDSGSQASFITESCVQRLRIKRHTARVSVSGLGNATALPSKGIVTLIIEPEVAARFKIDALILPKITSQLPQQSVNVTKISSYKGITLADPNFHKTNDIDMLIGADHFFDILQEGRIKTSPHEPVLQNTIFGWIVSGQVNGSSNAHITTMHSTTNSREELVDIDRSLKRFWELDSIIDQRIILSPEETYCEDHFQKHLQRDSEGRFVVRLPFKEEHRISGSSLSSALQRLRGIERRCYRDPHFANLYHDFLREYEQLNHMQEIPPEEVTDQGFYLPHHGVFKSSGSHSKLRVVFDGSSKTSSGTSLNDCLAIGPTVQSSLFSIILRFREHRFVLSADVQKMYRQITMSPEDRQFQKIVWRTNPSKPIRHFKLNTVTYGLASSSFLATRALKQIADDNKTKFPMAAAAISNDMYVDDLMTGADNEDELAQLQKDITSLLSSYGFPLRKWKSNCNQILSNAQIDITEDHLKELLEHDEEVIKTPKVLGISWNTKNDTFIFTSSLPSNVLFTKRTVLSEASRIFDPLGWLSPVVIKAKIFMQTLWADKLGWDEQLPPDKISLWEKIRNDLQHINSITIPRFINTSTSVTVELHGFCDASQLAYASVVYFKVTNPKGNTFISMISAKTKVAPIKQQTLPRLELCAAVLLTNLITQVTRETKVHINAIYTWTDSKIVLDWLGSHPKRWHTFVGNRTSHILDSLPRRHWRHVPSLDNPADSATRGFSPRELKPHDLWWHGPAWLPKSVEFWPPQLTSPGTKIEERCEQTISFTTSTSRSDWYDQLISQYSSFRKLQRVLGYIFRFVQNVVKPRELRTSGIHLNRKEIFHVIHTLCLRDQRHHYYDDILSLQANKEVKKSSSLKSLNPFLDPMGIIRVGGRLENSTAPYSTKHPIILHPQSQITTLIARDVHQDNKHAGPSLLLSLIRQEFWIPNGKAKVKEIVNKCVVCVKFKAHCQQQLMGNLPSSRVELIRPFLKTGVDYAGPIAIHLIKGRGQKTYKAYICLFICLSTKAVHLELVSDLSSDAFLGALKRFTARRGICMELHSDNGTNFIGAATKLKEEFSKLIKSSNNITNFLSSNRITWHFIPPSAPHFGGIWEAAIKSTKFHLKRVIGQHILTLDQMNTLLAEVEGILNSRPLCRVNETDTDPLTPSHFLIGHSNTKIPELDITDSKISHLSRWQIVQHMAQQFWKRWYIEYLTSLQHRSKWMVKKAAVQLNDIVVIKDNNLPVSQWLLGRIIELHTGTDGIVRVVTVKTKCNELKRPIHKLCVLPIHE